MTPSETPIQPDLKKLENEVMALEIAIHEMMNREGLKVAAWALARLKDEKQQQLKDAQFEQSINPLPFPEK